MGLPLVDEDSGDRMFWASSRWGDHELVAMIPFGPVGPPVIYMDTYTASANREHAYAISTASASPENHKR